jgi:hypothetical protein
MTRKSAALSCAALVNPLRAIVMSAVPLPSVSTSTRLPETRASVFPDAVNTWSPR